MAHPHPACTHIHTAHPNLEVFDDVCVLNDRGCIGGEEELALADAEQEWGAPSGADEEVRRVLEDEADAKRTLDLQRRGRKESR
jgi:hypothetical protein